MKVPQKLDIVLVLNSGLFGIFCFLKGKVMTKNRFENWFQGQLDDGLVDIKFSVIAGKNVSVESIKQELLTSEANIKAKNVNPAPALKSAIPEKALGIMARAFA